MATSVHIPAPLLRALDRRAKALRTSRNSLIVQAIERDLGIERGWPPGFFESLAAVSDAERRSLDATMVEVAAKRSSKKPVAL